MLSAYVWSLQNKTLFVKVKKESLGSLIYLQRKNKWYNKVGGNLTYEILTVSINLELVKIIGFQTLFSFMC